MTRSELYIFKGKCIITTSVALLLLAVGFATGDILKVRDISFETKMIDTQQMAAASVSKKMGTVVKNKKLIEVKKEEEKKVEQPKVEQINVEEPVVEKVPERVWYLPTEYGQVTSYPSWGHAAYDIISSRGSGEVIYPIAAGQISNIYYDPNGALVVTVRHYVDGRWYSSQYAHLSRFADIYVGQDVTPFTPLGWMGSTGYSTGVHLHIAVADCNMFGGDQCNDLNGFFNYVRNREGQGFHGLGSLIDVPYQWWSR